MKEKFINAIMGGAYIALGAITYLCIPNAIVGAMFFSTGLFLVFNFHKLLFTKVVPMAVLTKEYSILDIVITWFGNFIGAFFIALIAHFSRVEAKLLDSLKHSVDLKLVDTPLSLFLMGVFCAIFVSYAVFLSQRYKMDSFGHIFLVWILITAFIFGGYDHIVANFYYLSAYALAFGIEVMPVIKIVVFVTAGNAVGGILVAALEKRTLRHS